MKYSIVMPYYKRIQLKYTLISYSYHYANRNDFEIIIVEDIKNNESLSDHEELLKLINNYNNIKVILDTKRSFNPASKYNLGVENAKGEIIILTSPEIFHSTNVLSQLDKEDFSNNYIVCACLSVRIEKESTIFSEIVFRALQWYQHTQYRNASYHFCSAISKDNFLKIKFDERYCNGIAFEDNNFVKRVGSILTIVPRDDILTYHLEHDRSYNISKEEYKRLMDVNRKIWIEQYKNQSFF